MNNLKILREEKGLSQQQLCNKLELSGCFISRSAYSRYETGSRNIPCDLLIIFARFFETTTDNVLGLQHIKITK
ncbi:MAG: helix-turn-helix transcriptional regulator [Clostridia bacterium]|nr:helix-turn-helix transcriptional regulator [Clostridia bacterium]MBQ7121300.1 helix-turn-helix transcriptional regulator [Clostridia bacterium]